MNHPSLYRYYCTSKANRYKFDLWVWEQSYAGERKKMTNIIDINL